MIALLHGLDVYICEVSTESEVKNLHENWCLTAEYAL